MDTPEKRTFEDVARSLRDMGLRLTSQDLERVKTLYEFHQERMKPMYAADLENEEPATFLVP